MGTVNEVYAAIKENDLTKLRLLLDNNTMSYDSLAQGSLLLVAAKKGHTTIVEYLVVREVKIYEKKHHRHRFDLHRWHKINGVQQNPLIEVIKKMDIPAIKAITASPLFFYGSFKDANGNTPLHYVDKIKDAKKRKEIATILIERGMDITLKNNKGEKPVYYNEYEKIKNAVSNKFPHSIANQIFFKKHLHTYAFSFITAIAASALYAVFPAACTTVIVAAMGYFLANTFYKIVIDDFKRSDMREQIDSEVFYQLESKKASDQKIIEYMQEKKPLLAEGKAVLNSRTIQRIVSDGHTQLAEYIYQNYIKDADLFFALGLIVANPAITKLFAEKGANIDTNPHLTHAKKQLTALEYINHMQKKYFAAQKPSKDMNPIQQKFATMRNIIYKIKSSTKIDKKDEQKDKSSTAKKSSTVIHAFNKHKGKVTQSTSATEKETPVARKKRA